MIQSAPSEARFTESSRGGLTASLPYGSTAERWRRKRKMRAVTIFYCLSGLVSLGYQVVWFRVFIDKFGSTNLTLVTVVCTFIGGLGTGALASKRVAARLGRALRLTDPLRIYGAVELVIAAAALLTVLWQLLPGTLGGHFPYRLEDGVYERSFPTQIAPISVAMLCVFLPCFFMGITFPLLCFAFRGSSRFPSALYGWNTLGACTGILACEFLFLPQLGYGRTLFVMVALNCAIGLYFLIRTTDVSRKERDLSPGPPPGLAVPAGARQAPAPPERAPHHLSVVMACAVVSGLLCGALEGDIFKRLCLLDCNSGEALSFISFWAILAIFIASWTVRGLRRLAFSHIKVAYLAALAAYAAIWQCAYPLRDFLRARRVAAATAALSSLPPQWSGEMPFYHFRSGLGDLLLFVGVFVFPAYALASLLLPYVCNRIQGGGRHLGAAYGINTLAFCAGMIGFTWLAPAVNVFYSLKLFMVLFAVLVAALLFLREGRRLPRWLPAGALAALAAASLLVPAGFDKGALDPKSPAVQYPVRAMMSNAAHTTYVVDDPSGPRLFFDSHSMSGTAIPDQRYMRLMAHFPLLAHPDPKAALLLCFGVGVTGSAIATYETIERIDVVELNDKVYRTAPEFALWNKKVYLDPRVALIHDDGRSFLARTDRTYDLITSEPPPPMDEGVYRLYSQEYYRSVLAHLAPGGMMTQWLPASQMSPRAVGLAVSTFIHVFPQALLFVGSGQEFILVGSRAPIDLAWIERRFGDSRAAVAADLAAIDVTSPLQLLARIVMGDASLRREYASCRPISDQRNDFSRLPLDLLHPAVIPYDPSLMLDEVRAARLAIYPTLRRTVTNLARLKSEVTDFPPATLMSVARVARAAPVAPDARDARDARTGAADIAFADAPWMEIDRLNAQAMKARREGRLEEALRLFERSLALAGDQQNILAMNAEAQSQIGRAEDAIATWRRLLALEPDNGRADYGIGLGLFALGRYEEAIPYLRRAAALRPTSAVPRYVLGDLLATMGRFSQAAEAYDEVLAIDPHHADARKKRAALQTRLPGSP